MSTPGRSTRTGVLATLLASVLALGLGGCGDEKAAEPPSTPTTSTTGDAAPSGEWLIRFTTATGADGDKVGAVYVRYDPATGAAVARKLPASLASDAGPEDDFLLISADHAWAIPDTGVPRAQAHTGKLVLYGLSGDSTETLDIRAAAGKPALVAKAWAFDPTDAHVLRVVDGDGAVWKVDLATRTATQEGTLPRREGWIFANGFDKTTGEPYIESIDSDATEPAGSGDDDTRPLVRQGGTPVRYDGGDLAGLPKPPCDFAGAFRYADGSAWLFCADTSSITAYRAAKDATSWQSYGKPSAAAVPGSAVELSFALPPVG
jgi:hypothetical protein